MKQFLRRFKLLREIKQVFHEHRISLPAKPVSAGNFFTWPDGMSGAVSLTYDDGLRNHLELVAPALEAAGLRGTFYVHITSEDFQKDTAGWRAAAARGHELGNHTVFHPCRNNPCVHSDFDLRGYGERRWCREMELANWILGQTDGQAERTFGNTCWDNWIGPDDSRVCLEQLMPGMFPAARGEKTDRPVDPKSFNRYNLGTVGADGMTFAELQPFIEAAVRDGQWLILTFHGVGQGSHTLFMATAEHQLLLEWLAANRRRIWTAPVLAVSRHLLKFVK